MIKGIYTFILSMVTARESLLVNQALRALGFLFIWKKTKPLAFGKNQLPISIYCVAIHVAVFTNETSSHIAITPNLPVGVVFSLLPIERTKL